MRALRATSARHRLLFGLLAALGLGILLFGLVFFEPQALFLDDRVDEELPGASADTSEETDDAEVGAAPTPTVEPAVDTLLRGRFRGLNHSVEGTARVLDVGDGKLYLRFEDFEVANGPDLKVYLSSAPADSADDDAFARDFIDLGELKGNIGNQNYRLPAGADLDRYTSAVVWCRRFAVGFAVAGLE